MIVALLNSVSDFLRESNIAAEDIQLWVSIIAVGALAFLLNATRLHNISRWINQNRPGLKWVGIATAIAISVLVAFNYFYYSRTPGSWIHRWDIFHSSMNSRYFDELGYFKLYECTLVLGSDSVEPLREIESMRDLSTLTYIDTKDLFQTSDCQSRFSETRLASFMGDITFWNELMPNRWERLLKDKGYNGTPFYTIIYRNLIGQQPFSVKQITNLAFLDILFIGLAFYTVFRSYGVKVTFFAFLFFAVNFPNRFVHMGGSILRFDYLALLILGICALKSKRYALSASLMALATMIRVFPVLFAIGVGFKMLAEGLQNRKIAPNHLRFFAGFGMTILLGVLISLPVDGLKGWTNFFENSLQHNVNTAGFRIGLRHLFMIGGNMFGSGGFISFAQKTEIFNTHLASYTLTLALITWPFLRMVKRMNTVSFTVIFGTLSFYLLFASTRYYYSILVLLFLLIPDVRSMTRLHNYWVWIFLFMTSTVTFVAYRFNNFDPFIYNLLFSSLLGLFFVFLLTLLSATDQPLVANRRGR